MKYSDWPEDKKEKARAAHRRWKDRNHEQRKKYWQDYEKNRPIPDKLFRSMQQRKIDFDITPADITVPTNCPICGITMAIANTRGGNSASFTLDKVNPTKGYVKGNVAVICKLCNSKKGNSSAEELRRIADWIDSF